jgi:putative selenium metabolism hydrolase
MAGFEQLREAAREREEALVGFCGTLIRTRSMPGEEGDAARAVQGEMEALGYDDVWRDEVGNVVGVVRGTGGGPSVMLNTHLDHVSAGDESGWPFPPFEGRIHEGSVWGRGAMDIKGPTAAQVYGAALLKASGLAPEGDVYVACAVQEEVGGLGSIELARTMRADAAVIGEATNNELRRGHRGRIELIARVRGRSAHASMPERGVNPHYSLARFVSALESVELADDPFLGRETFVPTLVFTDQTSANVVPGEVRLHLDWRTVPRRSPEEIRAVLQRLLDGALVHGATGELAVKEEHLRTYTGAERDVPSAFPSFVLPEDDPVLVASRAALEEAFGRDVPVRRWEFATDGGHLMAAGIPCVGFGPGDETLAHTNQERVPVAQLRDAALGYAALALRLTTPW